MSLSSLKDSIELARRLQRPIAAVVSVLGTTELGFVDPIQDVQDLLDQYQKEEGLHIWHHVDAAYGGFFASMKAIKSLRKDLKISFEALSRVNSITIDPHKMGYVPYSSGAFLCCCEKDYFVKPFVAPYVQFQIEKDKGPFTLEGSRSAAGAVATWAYVPFYWFHGKWVWQHSRAYGSCEKTIWRRAWRPKSSFEFRHTHI